MNDTDVRCPKCMGTNGHHNTLHTRYGNGGGGNSPCPNDTTRVELREDVADAFRAFVGEMGGGEDWSQAYYDHADRIIALVTEHRDAEIREALLSDGALVVVENARFFDENSRELVERQIRHIGLHSDSDTGDER